MTLNITQIGTGHAIQGLAADTVTAEPTSGASLTGNFDMVSLQQTSIGNSTIALNVDVGLDASSDVSVDISGSGTHNVMLDAVAQELTSIITLDGPGAKSVNTYVDAVGKLVSHDIRLSGSAIELSAKQQASADLSVELFSPGSLLVPLPSSVTIKQTGEGSAAHILGNIGTDATLVFDQTGSETNYTLDVTLNPNSSLALNQISDGGVASGLTVVVPIGQTITITQ